MPSISYPPEMQPVFNQLVTDAIREDNRIADECEEEMIRIEACQRRLEALSDHAERTQAAIRSACEQIFGTNFGMIVHLQSRNRVTRNRVLEVVRRIEYLRQPSTGRRTISLAEGEYAIFISGGHFSTGTVYQATYDAPLNNGRQTIHIETSPDGSSGRHRTITMVDDAISEGATAQGGHAPAIDGEFFAREFSRPVPQNVTGRTTGTGLSAEQIAAIARSEPSAESVAINHQEARAAEQNAAPAMPVGELVAEYVYEPTRTIRVVSQYGPGLGDISASESLDLLRAYGCTDRDVALLRSNAVHNLGASIHTFSRVNPSITGMGPAGIGRVRNAIEMLTHPSEERPIAALTYYGATDRDISALARAEITTIGGLEEFLTSYELNTVEGLTENGRNRISVARERFVTAVRNSTRVEVPVPAPRSRAQTLGPSGIGFN